MVSFVTMQAVGPWDMLGQTMHRTYYVMGCMGMATSVGFGFAIAQPEERILIVDGDGSLLMQLGSLVSVSTRTPPNFYHVVMENGVYETSGGQSIPGRNTADLCNLALAAGYSHAVRFTSAEAMEIGLPRAFKTDGPVFIALVISEKGVVRDRPKQVSTPHKFKQALAQLDDLRREFTPSADPSRRAPVR